MTDLSQQVLIVAGGTGGIGEEIVKTLLSSGATVAVPSRSADHLEQLTAYCAGTPGRLLTLKADVSTAAGAQALQQLVQDEAGRLDGVVAALNSSQGALPLLEFTDAQWQDVLQNYLTSHFMMARTFLPELLAQNAGHYIMINGGAAQHVYPGLTFMSMMAAAQLMMTKGLELETASSEVALHSVVIYSRVATRHEAPTHAGQVTSEEVAQTVHGLLSGGKPARGQNIHELHMHKQRVAPGTAGL